MDLSLLLIVCVNCVFGFVGVEGQFSRMTIKEEEVKHNDEWFVRLHCHLINSSNVSASCQSFTWSHESETLDDDQDVYHIETFPGNSSSRLTILNPSESENSYTCTAECGTHIYRIICWVDFRQKEAVRICSERQITNIVISATTAPKTTRKKADELKIGISIVCVIVIGMTMIAIIKCRLKRKEALKHARALYENANQCLLYSNASASTCQRYSTRRSGTLPDDDNSPIYRPVQRQRPSALPNRHHRNLHRISAPAPDARHSFLTSSDIPIHNRLVLQEMTDGSQLVFIPGNAVLPSYEDSISSSPQASRVESFCRLSSFMPSHFLPSSFGQTGHDAITNSDVLSEEGERLSSPPSYTSMVQMNPNDTETELSTDSRSESTASSEGSSNENQEIRCADDNESPPISIRSHVPSISRYQPYPIGRPPPAYQERPDE